MNEPFVVSEAVLVGLITGGIGVITAILTHVITWLVTKKQCETQLKEAKLQIDAQLQQRILSEIYEARRKAFTELVRADSEYAKQRDTKNAVSLANAISAAHVVASPETAKILEMFRERVFEDMNSDEAASAWESSIQAMQLDLIEFTAPIIRLR